MPGPERPAQPVEQIMEELSENDQERIHSAFEYGSRTFTEDDLKKVEEDSLTAEEKAKYLGEQIEAFKLLWSLLRDYRSGEYKAVPWKIIASIGFAVAYLISPLDIVPDFIPIVGFVDDATVFTLVISSFRSDIDKYKKWKKEQQK
jgi:uncharacterized membrane protein YkvA (DUF1232 family)